MMWVSGLVQVAGFVARSRKLPQLLAACLSILAMNLVTNLPLAVLATVPLWAL